MNQSPIDVKAALVDDDTSIPIDVEYTSKYSLLIRCLDDENFENGKEFSNLVLRKNGNNYDLGRCRYLSEPGVNDYMGRLVCINEIYDLENLLVNDKLVRLENPSLKLPLLLPLKHRICDTFKNFTANLTYDLSLYKDLFDSLDEEYCEEPEHIREAIQENIINSMGKPFMEFLDKKLFELHDIVKDFSREESENHGYYFRKQLWNTIKSSPFIARTNLKPRGYAGDSEMMSMIYANDYWGNSTFSKLLHKHPLEQPGAEAVRNRRHYIAKMLNKLKQDHCHIEGKKLRVLSVACGPACEIQDILLNADDCTKFDFVLLDQDGSALNEAAKLIDGIQDRINTKIAAEFLNESVRTMLASNNLKDKVGQFDFIYSMGLFDYLLPPVASKVLGRLFELLKPGGEMAIGNFHVSNPSKYYMEYWLDWVLYYRTEGEFKSLLDTNSSKNVDITFDASGVQMFLHVKK